MVWYKLKVGWVFLPVGGLSSDASNGEAGSNVPPRTPGVLISDVHVRDVQLKAVQDVGDQVFSER